MHRVELSIRRAIKCHGCSLCVGKCPNNVIIIEDGVDIIGDECVYYGEYLHPNWLCVKSRLYSDFLYISEFLHKTVNTETIYFINDVIIFTYPSIEYCY